MATVEIIPIPIGSAFVQTIGADDPDDLNDFAVLISLDANGSGLEESDITLSTGASLVSLTGDGVTWEAVIRPPTTAGMLTITVGADAFSEGNVETSKDIRISTIFPDTDAEATTELFTHSLAEHTGIAVSPSNIFISTRNNGGLNRIYVFDFQGTAIEDFSFTGSVSNERQTLDYFNNKLYVKDGTFYELPTLSAATGSGINSVTHTEFGLISDNHVNLIFHDIQIRPVWCG